MSFINTFRGWHRPDHARTGPHPQANRRKRPLTDTNTEPGSQPEPGAETRTPIWLRGLMMLLLAILIGLGQTVLQVLTVLQFILMLIEKGRPNQQIAGFGKDLGDWLAKAAAFQTAASEDKPWPWTR